MSRIAGIVSRKAAPPRQALTAEMLVATRLGAKAGADRNTWRVAQQESRDATLGWTGWHAPAAAELDGMIAVVDGCFFNRVELTAGVNDAERLLRMYRKFGFTETMRHINGDFAVALYDSHENTLWLSRDRIAVKPLYYTLTQDLFAFSSRPRPLLGLPGVDTAINRKFAAVFAGSHYRYFDNDQEASPYKSIYQLPAAHVLQWRDGNLKKSCYWKLEELPDWTESADELAEHYRELLIDAVAIRVQQATSPGFTLSGGMDSSSVLASAVRHTGQRQQAISTVYEDATYDESDEIRTILNETVSQWHPVTLGTPDVLEVTRRMIEVHDEPIATATWLSHYLLCDVAAQKGFGSLFGGLGGDELNAGEYEYFWYHFADLKHARNSVQLQNEIEAWIKYHDHPIFRKSHELVESQLPLMVDLSSPGRCKIEQNRFTRYVGAVEPDFFRFDQFRPILDHPFRSYLKNRTFQDLFRETAPCCLRAEDRQATAFQLENYLPFFDHRLVEFMFRVPGHLKIRDGITKRLLRRAMTGILPDETRTRIRKTGWNAPAHVWFSGAGREPLMDLIGSQAFRERGIYNVAKVKQLADEHEQIVSSGRLVENHMMFFWQLVNLELWISSLSDQRCLAEAA